MLQLRLKNPVPDRLAHHAPFPHLNPDAPLKPRIEPKTERRFQIICLPQKDGSFVASVVEAPAILVYDRSRKAAEKKAAEKFLKTPDPHGYTHHPLSLTKAVTVEMEYDESAGAFVTYVKELHGISTFGDTESAALEQHCRDDQGLHQVDGGESEKNSSGRFQTRAAQTRGRSALVPSAPAISGNDAVRALERLGRDTHTRFRSRF